MPTAFILSAISASGIFSEGAPHGSNALSNLADGPALLLYLGLIVVIGLIVIWNAHSYQAPAVAHGHGGQEAAHAAHAEEPELHSEEAEAEPAQRDDLKIIEGIGPKTEAVFWAAGIYTFKELAEMPVEKLDQILDAAGLRLGDPATWPEQARLAAEGDWDGLQQLQDRLKGGRAS